ncbi:MAG: hypothetical protein ACOX6Y_05605 [Christensenellales bacterium]|jgi:exopolyphosphatase/guanosine-5'-triphosphate,3'-diphosphate pyrophosphatase
MREAVPRAAVIIIGSNSTRMLTADLDDRLSNPVFGRRETRLFLALDKENRLPVAAIEAACRDVASLFDLAREAGADRTFLMATSATRDSANGKDLAYALLQATGLSLQVISGEEEAAFSFWGAVHPFPGEEIAGVIDIGGGSAEIALGRPGEAPFVHSLQLGASRLYAAQPINSPADADKALMIAARAAREGVRGMTHQTLVQSSRLWADPARWLLVGGTGTALISLMQGALFHRGQQDAAFTRGDVMAMLLKLADLSPEARAALPGMTPGREHILPTGLAALAALMDALNLNRMAVTARNNTDGVLWRLARYGSLRFDK